MAAYLIKRLLLIIPTLIGVLTLTFALAQFAPGNAPHRRRVERPEDHAAVDPVDELRPEELFHLLHKMVA